MGKTFSTERGDDFICGHCGSIYEVSIFNAPFKESDSESCEVCGELLKSWRSTSIPSFKLKIRGTGNSD